MEQLNSKIGEQEQQRHYRIWSYEHQIKAIHSSSDQYHNHQVQHPLDVMGNKIKMGTSDLNVFKQQQIITKHQKGNPRRLSSSVKHPILLLLLLLMLSGFENIQPKVNRISLSISNFIPVFI